MSLPSLNKVITYLLTDFLLEQQLQIKGPDNPIQLASHAYYFQYNERLE